jgi:hypothetical protein
VVVTTTGKPAAAWDFSAVREWLGGTAFTPHTGDLALPRFAASGREDLLPVLDAVGLREARKSPAALQGFGPGIVLSQMTQRAMIDIDEEGAESRRRDRCRSLADARKRGCYPHGGGQAVHLRAARQGNGADPRCGVRRSGAKGEAGMRGDRFDWRSTRPPMPMGRSGSLQRIMPNKEGATQPRH